MGDLFEIPLAIVAASHENDSQLVKSIAITESFRKLSVYIAQVVPGLLEKYVFSDTHDNNVRIQILVSLLSDVEDVEDGESILSFFSSYLPFLKSAIALPDSNVTSSTRALVDYLEKQLSQDLTLATHLDVSDLVKALKRGTLSKLSELAQRIHGEIVYIKQFDDFTTILQARISKYEWVSKLMSVQEDIDKYLKIGKVRALDDSERVGLAHLIGMDSLSDSNCKAALEVLGSGYGIVQCKIQGPPDHAIITVSAANLSLRDIIGAQEDGQGDGHPGKPTLSHLLGIRKLMGKSNTAPKGTERYGDIERKAEEKSNHVTVTVRATTLPLHDLLKDRSHGCKEVRFMCKECFYLDTSLNCSESSVSNVAIIAPNVVVVGNRYDLREINVSGSDGKSYPASSHTSDGKESSTYGSGAHGKDGDNGGPGESGGNILICTDKIENSQLLILCSDGGKGGDGQGGGNGRDGKAKPSISDDLSHFGGYETLSIYSDAVNHKIFSNTFRCCYSQHLSLSESDGPLSSSEYAYGVSPDGIQILLGNYKCYYAFLYSRGVNGVSADGGNAGRGGKGGGGGKGGHIVILKMNGSDCLHDHNVQVSSQNGPDGQAGKPGKPGKRDVAESRRDYLILDGWLKPVLRYDGFINALPYTGKDPSRLERGLYYCDPSVAKCFDPKMTSGNIEFFKAKRNKHCLTKSNREAKDGKEQKKEKSVVQSTPSRLINKAEIQREFRKHSTFEMNPQVQTSSFQLLEEMQRTIDKRLESTCVKEEHKQIWRVDLPVQHHSIVAKSFPKVIFGQSLPSEIITNLNENALVSEDDHFEASRSTEEMFSKLVSIIENNLAKQRRKGEEWLARSRRVQEHSSTNGDCI